MSALPVSFAVLALVLGSLVVFGLYLIGKSLCLIELHLGKIGRGLSDMRHDGACHSVKKASGSQP